MKILQINVDYDGGGPGTIASGIHDAVVASGGESIIAYSRDSVDANIPSIRIGNKISEYSDALSARLVDNAGFASHRGTKKLIQHIEKLNPDIIHLHNLLGYYINLEDLFNYLKITGIPTVWTLHDCWAFTGHCINFERINCTKWKCGCYHCPFKKEYPTSWLLDKSKRNYNKKKELYSEMENLTLVAPSKWISDLVKESFLKNLQLYRICNGINLSNFKPTESNYRQQYQLENKKVLLAVAYVWNEMKGDELLDEIAEKLDDSFRIVMIGNKRTEPKNKKIISIPPTGSIDELRKWYTAANVFINPTLGDNFPTVNIEALACGTPVVTNNTGGSGEIAGNESGRIVYSKNADEFVDKIYDCINMDFSEEQCLLRAQLFDKNILFQKYIELYNQILYGKEV